MWHSGPTLGDKCHSYLVISPDKFRYAPLHSVHGVVCPVPGMSGCVMFPTPVAAAGMLAAGKPGFACAWVAVMPGSPSTVPNGSLGIPDDSLGSPEVAWTCDACATGSGLGAAACSSSCCSGGDSSCATRCLCKCCCQLTSVLRHVRAL